MRYGSLLAAALLAGVGSLAWYWIQSAPSAPAAPSGPPRPGMKGAGRFSAATVPVTVSLAKKETVPIYREGIGNVQALFTVTVRSQIDGRLSTVDFVEGQIVRKGDVLARIDPVVYKAQYDQAVAKKAQDMATLANAKTDLARYQRLAQTNAGPQQQADQQAAVVAQLEAQVQSDIAAIDNARAFLDYTTIASPIDGRTGLRQIDPGNIIHASDANGLVSIAQIDPIAVVFTLPQRDLQPVAAALAAGRVDVEVLEASGRGVLSKGSLQTMDNQIDVTTGTIKLKATFPNPDQKLWPGQFVSTRVVVDTLRDATVVPTEAVRRGPIGTFVYVVSADLHANLRKVEVVTQDEIRAVIKGGIQPGERVVTVGFAQLTDGKVVQVPADAPPADAATGASERKRGTAQGDETKQRDQAPDGSERKKRRNKEVSQ